MEETEPLTSIGSSQTYDCAIESLQRPEFDWARELLKERIQEPLGNTFNLLDYAKVGNYSLKNVSREILERSVLLANVSIKTLSTREGNFYSPYNAVALNKRGVREFKKIPGLVQLMEFVKKHEGSEIYLSPNYVGKFIKSNQIGELFSKWPH
jgi:hypothetical protein